MSRHLTVATVIEKNKIASVEAFLPALEVDVIDPLTNQFVETLYLVANNEDIQFQGKNYKSFAFEYKLKKEAGTLPTIEITGYDFTKTIQGKMQAYGGGVGFAARIIVINTGNLEAPPEMSETFQVITARAQNYQVSFSLGSENPLAMRLPRRFQFKDRCPWRYKGVECGYTGSLPTCDFGLNSPNGCRAHNNNERFGGFPGIRVNGNA